MQSTATPAADSKPAAWTWQKLFLVAFLAAQLLVPLSYYGCDNDSSDERFSWRMFSTTRSRSCSPIFAAGDDGSELVSLPKEFHLAWITIAKRGRRKVVERMAEKLCEEHTTVRMRMVCRDLDGSEERYGGMDNVCEGGSL